MKQKPEAMEPREKECGIIEQLIAPENSTEKQIIQDPEWRRGAFWGKPRWGHPEGKTIYHIKEVLDNIEQLSVEKYVRQALRFVAIIHDNFKHLEKQSNYPKDPENHHAVFARKFAATLISDPVVLDIIELHDEAFYAWRLIHIFKSEEKGLQKLNRLKERIGENIQIYYLFFKCDTQTGDKIQHPVEWFEHTFEEITPVVLV